MSLGVSSLLCILELSRLTRVEYGSQKHNYNCNIQGVSIDFSKYQLSAQFF